jgi:hypothetical protein
VVEPISTVIISAAAGGAAGKLSEKAWHAGEKWLNTYFKDHQPKAIEKAKDNSKDFLSRLAAKVARLEEQQQFDRSMIDRAMEDPSFAAVLQKALIGSAQTNSTEKHQLLAQLLTGKLSASSEKFASVVAPLACDAVVNATLNQLKILAIQTVLTIIHPHFAVGPNTEDEFLQRCDKWLSNRLKPLLDTKVRYLDLLHLESLSCAKHMNIGGIDLDKILEQWSWEAMTLTREKIFSFSTGKWVKHFWEDRGLNKVVLTSTGQLLGVNMLEVLGVGSVDLTGWGEDLVIDF